jgi:hypothetical protein
MTDSSRAFYHLRIEDARARLRSGESRELVRQLHGGVVLREAEEMLAMVPICRCGRMLARMAHEDGGMRWVCERCSHMSSQCYCAVMERLR